MLQRCLANPEATGDAVKVCLLPILRYVKSSGCGDAKQIINLMEDNFADILMGAASSCRNVITSEGEKSGLSLYTFDPVAAFGGGQKLAAKASSAGLIVWQENDPVNLTSAAYKDVTCLIQHQAGSLVLSAPASGRRRIKCIIPGQPKSSAPATWWCPDGSAAQKRARATVAEAAEAAATAPTPINIKVKMLQVKDPKSEEKAGNLIIFF